MTRHQGFLLILVGLFLAVLGSWNYQGQSASTAVLSMSASPGSVPEQAEDRKIFQLVLHFYLGVLRRDEMTLDQASAEMEAFCRANYAIYLNHLAYVEEQPTDRLLLAANLLRHLDMEGQASMPSAAQRRRLQEQFAAMQKAVAAPAPAKVTEGP